MRTFAVVIYVEAEDSVAALEAAGDRFANMEALRQEAALGDRLKIRPARRRELET